MCRGREVGGGQADATGERSGLASALMALIFEIMIPLSLIYARLLTDRERFSLGMLKQRASMTDNVTTMLSNITAMRGCMSCCFRGEGC